MFDDTPTVSSTDWLHGLHQIGVVVCNGMILVVAVALVLAVGIASRNTKPARFVVITVEAGLFFGLFYLLMQYLISGMAAGG